uniref:vasorin-like n=1 Tax=Styela clava TaxID=7725 RepID=UPI00193A2088|nr:vasorin-like [Styela clava]
MEISCTQNASMRSQSKQGFIDFGNCDRRIQTINRRRQISSSLLWKIYYLDRTSRAAIIILSLILMGNGTNGANCPAKCSCQAANTAFCNHKALTYFPMDFSPSIEKLYLFHNNITRINPRAIANLKNLKLLDLSGNKISDSSLWKGIFSQLRLLENLILQDNEIKSISADMFQGLNNLARIYLQGNQISYIANGAFNNLPNLVELKLRNNKLVSFPRLINTSNLLLLDLGHNMLRSIPDMTLSTVNLEHLMLQDNRLTQLRTSIFDDTSRLTQLDISKNRLTAVPLVIKSLSSLRALNMSLNRVRTIPADTFTDMKKLKTLDIHGMGLTSLPFGIIPRGVILNVFDMTDNDWDCRCDASWLPQYISVFRQAFVNPDGIKCSATSKLKNRKIEDLSADDFQCTEEELAKTHFPPKVTTTTSATTTSSDPRKPWAPNPCDVYPCFHKGTCYLSNGRPKCRCTRYWTGPQCKISLLPTTTTTSTIYTRKPSTRSPAKPELMINQDSVTENSVEIILPQTDTELLVSVSEIGEHDNTKELRIKPIAHPFTVLGLESGKSYNICIHLPLGSRNDRNPPYIEERDTLCGSVRTEGISVINKPVHNTEIQVVPSLSGSENVNPTEKGTKDKDVKEYKPGEGDKLYGDVNPETTPTESSNFQIIYPAIGAGIGAIIIIVLIVMFFVCYRQRRRKKFKQNNPDYVPGSPIDTTQMVDMEMAPTMHLHQHNHYPAGWVDQANGSKSDKNKKNTKNKKQINYINNNQKAKKVSTPNRTSSPGSNSSSSNGGTLQTRYADTPLHYSPHQQYNPATPPIQMQYDVMPQQMNGRANEYIYRNHQNNNNSAMLPPNNHYMPRERPYDHEVMDEMAPLVVGGMNPYNYGGHLENQMYPISQHTGPTYIAPSSAVSYPQVNSRSAFQPIQSPRKNTVRTPTSDSGPITTHVNTVQVLPTSTCLNRNVVNDSMVRYQEGVPVV